MTSDIVEKVASFATWIETRQHVSNLTPSTRLYYEQPNRNSSRSNAGFRASNKLRLAHACRRCSVRSHPARREDVSSSELVPKEFQGKIANCAIALGMAHRMAQNPMAVVQNLYCPRQAIVVSAVRHRVPNQCGKFSPLRFRIIGDGDDKSCTAWARGA